MFQRKHFGRLVFVIGSAAAAWVDQSRANALTDDAPAVDSAPASDFSQAGGPTLVCGGIAGIPCPVGQYCEFPIGTCDIIDNQGSCTPIPQGCPDNWDPVCGCDGVTYGNACDANAASVSLAFAGPCGPSFVNWETPHVHPLDITPDRSKLLAVNTPDNRLEVFDIRDGTPIHVGSVPVGLDPVTVRAFGNESAWVINHISDSISIVNLTNMNAVATVATDDEPADVVFAGNPRRAFVSCSQANVVQVFPVINPAAPLSSIAIDGEEPRALATNAGRVYVAIFESGNQSTALAGNGFLNVPQIVKNPATPYGGVDPPPNAGNTFNPPLNPANPPPPPVSLIVKKDAAGRWMDDNSGDWTQWVSGPDAALSGRPVGWDLPDHDVAVIDTATLGVSYVSGLMNICMSLAVNPASGRVAVVGTDGINQIRFEPLINGRFHRVNIGLASFPAPTNPAILDLNPHLSYPNGFPFVPIPQAGRDRSVGDPRGIVWNSAGTRGYVTGMGSNNMVVIDANGNRIPPLGQASADPIDLGEGPTGLAIDNAGGRLYVLNKFAASISTLDLATETVIGEISLHDPSPTAIKTGRKHQYDTHKNSGLGHIACGSCHVDSRNDRLAWDLGDPSGDMKPFDQNCGNNGAGACPPWHPMKGPMVTQTLQDIIGKEPHHWRGDRNGIEEFNPAFEGLLGDDTQLTPEEMQEYEDFLATIFMPPNPFRQFDNALPSNLPLTGHFSTGRFSPAGTALPAGDAQAGMDNYRTGLLLANAVNCSTCHTLPTGMGSNLVFDPDSGDIFEFPAGPDGGLHHAITRADGSDQPNFKIPQLRTVYKKVGFDTTQQLNRSGFGFLHDGTVDSIVRFHSLPPFTLADDQELADMTAFMLAFAGSDLPVGGTTDPADLLGPSSNDTHAAVGAQVTFNGGADAASVARLDAMVALADSLAVGLVAKGIQGGLQRGYQYVGEGVMQSDRLVETVSVTDLRMAAAPGSEVTFTVVPRYTERRIGIDRDEDGHLDRDELDACSDPADAQSIPGSAPGSGDHDGDGDVDLSDYAQFAGCLAGPGGGLVTNSCACSDAEPDADVDLADFQGFQASFE